MTAPAPGPVELVADRLAGLPDLPVAAHVEAFEQVSRLLQDVLATLDEA